MMRYKGWMTPGYYALLAALVVGSAALTHLPLLETYRAIGVLPVSIDDPLNLLDLVVFQLSASLLTVAFISMVGDSSNKTLYGTRIVEFLLERPRYGNWNTFVSWITVLAIASLVCLLWKWYALIPWFMLAASLLLLRLIRIISKLFFNDEGMRRKIRNTYETYVTSGLSDNHSRFKATEDDLQRLYFQTQEYLNKKSLDHVRENFSMYVFMITAMLKNHMENAEKTSAATLSEQEKVREKRRQKRIKEIVMHYAFLIEECKSVKQNDLVITTCLEFLRSYFTLFDKLNAASPTDEWKDANQYLIAVLGGYKRQILDKNYLLPFLPSFDFKVAHFLCQGVNGQPSPACIRALVYLERYSTDDYGKRNNVVEIIDNENWSPLMEACEYGGKDIVAYLIQKVSREHLLQKDNNGLDAAAVALLNGNDEIQRMILKKLGQ
ncbi:MAG: hypothetical protein IT270_15110 [Saprospiraceae bacterium]|nr:hypothetical protein [Saprospiraceae bacterium]